MATKRNRKMYISGFFHETCLRTEEGLPLPPNPIIKAILESVLARAQTLYPIIICHFLVMCNHIHLLFIVKDPEQAARFILYVKRETSHSINRLRGRAKKTVWEERSSAMPILDAAQAKNRVTYALVNAQKADLVDKIEDYPGLSSWNALLEGTTVIKRRRINRHSIEALPNRTLSLREMREIADSYSSKDETDYELRIEPNAWMKCFDETKDLDPAEVNKEIIERIRERETEYRQARKSPVLGAHALTLQSMNLEYIPRKHAPKMLCLSSFKELRLAFIRWYRDHIEMLAHGILPPGCFLPGGKLLANVNPLFVPCANNYLFMT